MSSDSGNRRQTAGRPPDPGPENWGFVRRWWDRVVWLGRMLWVCRVSAASAGAGLLLMGFVVQAQNLLADTSWNTSVLRSALFWVPVFLAIFLFWAFPVHYAARRALADPAWLIPKRVRDRLSASEQEAACAHLRGLHPDMIRWVPRVLGFLPFLAYALAIRGAYDALERADALPEVSEVRLQLTLLLVLNAGFAALFWISVIKRQNIVRCILWTGKTIAARHGRNMPSDRLVRLIVRLSIIVTSGLFLVAYLAPVWVGDYVPRAALIPFLFGAPVLVLAALARVSHRVGAPLVLMLVLGVAILTAFNVSFNDVRTLEPTAGTLVNRQIDFEAAARRWAMANGCDLSDPKGCPPPLIIAADGGASRAAFMTASTIGSLIDRMPDVRDGKTDPSVPTNPARRIFALSGVSGGALGVTAVRAALADAAETSGDIPCRRPNRTFYRARTVSEQGKFTTWRDCFEALVSGDFLSPVFVGLAYRDYFAPFHMISSRAKLDDRAALLEEAWERHYDFVTCGGRRCRTNSSWFETGASCVGLQQTRGLCRRFGYLAGSRLFASHEAAWVPLLALNSTSVQTGRRVLVSDAVPTRTSARAESRVPLHQEAYDLFEAMSTPCTKPDDKTCTVAVNGKIDSPALRDGPDLRLSTAALTSARFPVISPAGAISMKGMPSYGDQLVDGGYFENAGLTTAREIAVALEEFGLRPLILTINNEPEQPPDDRVPPRPAETPTILASEVAGVLNGFMARFFGLASAPLLALVHTRDGHEAEARKLAFDEVTEGAGISFFKIKVFAETRAIGDAPDASLMPAAEADRQRCKVLGGKTVGMTKVSMSWWLSGAVQADLDAQLCDPRNQKTFDDLIARLQP